MNALYIFLQPNKMTYLRSSVERQKMTLPFLAFNTSNFSRILDQTQRDSSSGLTQNGTHF